MNETRFDSSQFRVGGEVGNFRITKLLGEGGMGAVFEAEDVKLGRKVALKVMHSHIATIPGAKEKFLREARTAASVEHDRIVRIYSIHDEGDFPYITMELLQGESLHHYLNRQRIPSLGFTLQVGLHVAQGLFVAHSAGLIHRDIKPSNIWIEPHEGSSFRCKILDFGLARGGNDGMISHATNQGMGTPMYMSPEQWQGVGLDARSDLFSLGVILYQMGSGLMPFEGDTLPSIMFAVMQTEPRLVGALNPALPTGLAEVIMRLLAKDKEDRPSSGKEVAEIMSDLLRENERLLGDDLTDDPRRKPVPSPEIETESDIPFIGGVQRTNIDPSSVAAAAMGLSASVDPPSVLAAGGKSHAKLGIILGAVFAALIVGIIAFWPRKGDSRTEVVKNDPKKEKVKEPDPETDKKGPEKIEEKKTEPKKVEPDKKSEPEKKAGTVDPPKVPDFLDCTKEGLTKEDVAKYQREYAASRNLKVDFPLDLGNGVSMSFVLIPPGKFWMGSVPGEAEFLKSYEAELDKLFNEKSKKKRPTPEPRPLPPTVVSINKAFYMGKFEVTRGQFARFAATKGYKTAAETKESIWGWDEKEKMFVDPKKVWFYWDRPGWLTTPEHPVCNVSWNDCDAFVKWATAQARLPEGFNRVRLPSEAEWEFACRAGTRTIFEASDDPARLTEMGNVADQTLNEVAPNFLTVPGRDRFAFTGLVGSFPANAFGLHDMTGNVMEWCRDGYREEKQGKNDPPKIFVDPEAERSDRRVIHGGSFYGNAPKQRVSRRDEEKVETMNFQVGFRLVIE